MLIALLLIVYVLFTALVSGSILTSFICRFSGESPRIFSFTHIAIGGLVLLSCILSIEHVFISISLASHIITWLILTILWLLNRKVSSEIAAQIIASAKNNVPAATIVFAGFVMGALLNVAAKPGVGDIADYHLQAIQWMEKFKLVPGLGNLRNQLGNYSNWYALNAFFGLHFIAPKSAYVLNASLLIMVLPYFLSGALRSDEEPFLKVIKITVLVYLLLTLYRKYVGAVTNDYAVTVLTLFVFTNFIESGKSLCNYIYLFLLCCTMVTLKQSAIFILPVTLYVFYLLLKQSHSSMKMAAALMLSGILIFVPWLYGNVLSCGYLFFPVVATGFFDVDWKMTPERMQWIIDMNIWWPRAPFETLEVAMKYSFSEWFPKWLGSQDLFSLGLLGAFIISSFAFLFLLLFKRKALNEWTHFNATSVVILITVYLALIVWYTNGPTPRFIFGYAVFAVAWFLSLFIFLSGTIHRLSHTTVRRILSIAFVAIFTFSTFIFIKSYYTSHTFAAAVLRPRDYPEPAHFEYIDVSGTKIMVPQNLDQCWDQPLPCSSMPEKGLEMRGPSLEDGFRISNK